MRTLKATISILVILFSSSLVDDNALGQVTKRNRLEINISYLVPHSKVVFKRSYGGIIGVDLTYLRKVKSHLLLGGLFEHSRFKLDDPEVIKATPIARHTKSNISSGAIVGGVEFPLNKIINATFQIGLGYSWILLKMNQIISRITNQVRCSGPCLQFNFYLQQLDCHYR
jgi:hypothetical protein